MRFTSLEWLLCSVFFTNWREKQLKRWYAFSEWERKRVKDTAAAVAVRLQIFNLKHFNGCEQKRNDNSKFYDNNLDIKRMSAIYLSAEFKSFDCSVEKCVYSLYIRPHQLHIIHKIMPLNTQIRIYSCVCMSQVSCTVYYVSHKNPSRTKENTLFA